jgi:16S rRNA (cytosine967-C5)-methyltransferase
MSLEPALDPRRIAAEVVRRALEEDAFAAAVLSAALDAAPQLDARDRGFATELTYGTLRAARYLEGRLVKHATRGLATLDATTRAHLLVGAYQLLLLDRVPAHAAVGAAVEAIKLTRGKGLASFANAVLRRLSEDDAAKVSASEAVRAGAPRWLVRALDRALGAGGGHELLSAGPVPPPLGLRVRRGDVDAHLAAIAAAVPGAEVSRGRAAHTAILVRGGGDPRRLPGVADGSLVVQEEGSQVVAESLSAKPGDVVLDACAGRGNKTLALLDAVTPGGRVDAADLHPAKLDRLEIEARKLGLAIGNRHGVDWTVGRGDVPAAAYDRVLVDAPCSGIGTLRRRPEILLRRTENDLVALGETQRAILRHAATALKPGGTLVYAVCSVLREEAEDVASALEGFEVASVRRLLPHVEGTDGYTVVTFAPR